MVARTSSSNLDKVKALAYPILLAVLAWNGQQINSKLDQVIQDNKAIKAYINYKKGKEGDANLITKSRGNNWVRMEAKKENIYDISEYLEM